MSVFLGMTLNSSADFPPSDGRDARAEYVSSFIKPGAVGAEIGVNHGVFAYHVLLRKNPSKLYLIDPWEYGLQADYETERTPENQKNRDLQNMERKYSNR